MRTKVLYVCTKQPDYSRIVLLFDALNAHADVDCIYSNRKTYLGRVLEVCARFLVCRKAQYDCVVVGFFAQLIFPFVRLLWKGKLVADCYISLYDSYVHDRGMTSVGSPIAFSALAGLFLAAAV